MNTTCHRPGAAPKLLKRQSFLTTTSLIATRGCLTTAVASATPFHGRFAHAMPGCATLRADRRRICRRTISPTPSSSITISGSRPGIPCGPYVAPCDPWKKIWSAAVTLDVTDDPSSLIREMALAGCTGVFIGLPESLSDSNLVQCPAERPLTVDICSPRAHSSRSRDSGKLRSFVLGFDNDHRDVFRAHRRLDRRQRSARVRHFTS